MFDQLFHQSKELLISKVEEGVNAFNIKWQTCLQTDWIKRVVSDIYFSRNIAIILIKKLQYAAQTIEN